MKRLYLIRHARSNYANSDVADFDRSLNERGEQDARQMGRRFKKQKAGADLIISSPAKRALATASIIANEINFPIEKIVLQNSLYSSGLQAMLNTIRHLDDSLHEVMLFGHNPDLTALANYLSNHQVASIPTCGVICMDFELNSWEEITEHQGIFKFFDYPEKNL